MVNASENIGAEVFFFEDQFRETYTRDDDDMLNHIPMMVTMEYNEGILPSRE